MELEQRRRELVLKDVKGRVDGMVEKLRGRWALEGVGARLCFGDGDGGRLRGFGGFTFTEEEWEMHGVLLVREGRPVGDEGLWW